MDAGDRVRDRDHVDPGGGLEAAAARELVVARLDRGAGVSVVPVLLDQELPCARRGRRPSDPQGQLVGLGAAADEVEDVEVVRELRSQALRVPVEPLVQVARVGVEQPHLALARGDHPRVAVPHMRHVVDRVQERPSLGVEEGRPLAADDLQRSRLVVDGHGPAEGRAALDVKRVRVCLPGVAGVQSEQRRGVGTQAGPGAAPRRGRHAGEVAGPVEPVEDDLEVQVGRPAAVDRFGAEAAHVVAGTKDDAGVKPPEDLLVQVPVQGEEGAPALTLVLEDDGGPVVQWGRVALDAEDLRGERCEDVRPLRREEVDAEVDGSRLWPVLAGLGEGLRAVQQPGLVVVPDRRRGTPRDPPRLQVGGPRRERPLSTPLDGEGAIQREVHARRVPQWAPENRREGLSPGPALEGRGAGDGGDPGGVAEHRGGEGGVDQVERLEGAPGGRGADLVVVVLTPVFGRSLR